MESKFYVGQKVVALSNSISNNVVVKGNVYTVLEIKRLCCFICIRVDEDVSVINNFCPDHDVNINCNGRFFNQEAFAPIQEQEISSMTYEDAIELVSEKVNV